MMEKFDAKRYRRRLLVRHVLGLLVCLLALAVLVYRFANEGSDDPGWLSASSLSCILHLIMMRSTGVQSGSILKALRDDTELRRIWNAEHDEREMLINAKAGIPLMKDTAIVLACIGFVVGLWELALGSGIVLASLIMNCVSTYAYDRWHKRLSQEDEEESEEA